MSRPLRILFLITSLDRGGAQRQVVDLASRLVADGWPVTVMSMIPPAYYVDELTGSGVRVVSLRMDRGRAGPLALARYGRFIRAWKPDIVHSHMVHANLLARIGRAFAPRVPVICTVHNVHEGARWREVAYRLTDRLATTTTAVSVAAADRYVRVGAAPRGRISAVPNGFDFSHPTSTDAREKVRRELFTGDAFLWLTAGRLDEQKGHDLLLDAFAQVRRVQAGTQLAIAGAGPAQAALAEQIIHLRLSDVVHLLGDRPDVPELLSAADGFVLSSRWEGLPMVLLEAAAQRVPIVSTDVGGNSEVVRPELGGVLVGVDAQAIAEGMLEIMSLPPDVRSEIGSRLRAHVQSGYDMTVIADRWKGVYAKTAG